MTSAYGIITIISLLLLGVCIVVDKKREIWLLLVFMAVFICNFGYYMLSISKTLEIALIAHKISYLGNVFLLFFLFMMIWNLCHLKFYAKGIISLLFISIGILVIVASPGILTIYYKSVSIVIENGVTKLIREYGPLHILYYIYLAMYFMAMLGVILYAIRNKKISSRSHVILLLLSVLCNILIWFIEQFLPRGFEFLSISYILTELFLLILYHLMDQNGLLNKRNQVRTVISNLCLVIFMLILASFIRVTTKQSSDEIYMLSNIISFSILIGLLASWNISLKKRIIQKSLLKHLIIVTFCMFIWILLRTFRHTVFLYVYPEGRWTWYGYYIAMILIPLFSFFASLHIGESELWVMSKKWHSLLVPAFILILLILTNDIHHLAFQFYAGHELSVDIYEYGIVYYLVLIWILSFLIAMIIQVLRRCRIPQNKIKINVPIFILIVGIVYTILYSINSDAFGFIEMTVALCFIVISIWESCMQIGLIQVNSDYDKLFTISNINSVIVDHEYSICFSSSDSLPLSKETMMQTKQGSFIQKNGMRISSAKIQGGWVIWQENISELLRILEQLENNKRILSENNYVLKRAYETQKKIEQIKEKNRLHDSLLQDTRKQIEMLNGWLVQFSKKTNETEKRKILSKIVVVGTYLKRRNNLIFVNEQEHIISEEEFSFSIEELIKNLELTGVLCGYYVEFKRDIPFEIAMELIGFYEFIVENLLELEQFQMLFVKFYCHKNQFRASIDVMCNKDLQYLENKKIKVKSSEDGLSILSLIIEEGRDR